MWHDSDTTVDYLNFRLVATACADLIRAAEMEPLSIGVSGGWGAGKSSLIRMVESELRGSDTASGQSNHVFVTFNPWLYQGYDDARTALLQIVGDAMIDEAKSREGFLDKAMSVVKRINLLRLAQMGGETAATLLTGVPVGLFGRVIDGVAAAVKDESLKEGVEAVKNIPAATKGLLDAAMPVSIPKEIQSFRISLEKLLEEMGITLVVFVDDLDRCLPKTAIATLEAIRLLLFLRRSAFVIAADDKFIRGAVKVHFAGTEIDDDIATSYFDKLIQVPLRVPRLGPNETKAYIALLFLEHAKREGHMDEHAFSAARTKVEKRLRETWKGDSVDLIFLEGLAPTGNIELIGLMGLAERLAPLLLNASAVLANPRLIKRFLNTVFLRKRMAEPQNIDLDVRVLAKWHLLERCDENLANALAEQVSAQNGGCVSVLLQAEAAANTGDNDLPPPFVEKPFVREWLRLPPALGEMDMRPLLHLSRDGAVRDFGAGELSEEGQQLREALVAAKSATGTLVDLIRKAGETQAGIAMARAWEIRRPSRQWQKAEDIVMLVEVCKVFPSVAVRAAALVEEAPVDKLTPVIAHSLTEQAWAAETIKKWGSDSRTPEHVKKAIAKGKQ